MKFFKRHLKSLTSKKKWYLHNILTHKTIPIKRTHHMATHHYTLGLKMVGM